MIEVDTASFVSGIHETVEKLTEALGESTLRQAGFAGAAIFREESKRNAASHKKTGALHRNIIVKRLEEESESNQRQAYLVTVRSGKRNTEGDAFYWRWVERGHKNVPRKPKSIGWKAHRLEYGTSTTPAYPFIRPAYESKKSEVIAKMQETIAKALQEGMGKI